jgi:hypothetical protein
MANARSQATTGFVRDGTAVDHIDSSAPREPQMRIAMWGPAAHPGAGAGGGWPPPRVCPLVRGGEWHDRLGATRQGSYSPRHSGEGVPKSPAAPCAPTAARAKRCRSGTRPCLSVNPVTKRVVQICRQRFFPELAMENHNYEVLLMREPRALCDLE